MFSFYTHDRFLQSAYTTFKRSEPLAIQRSTVIEKRTVSVSRATFGQRPIRNFRLTRKLGADQPSSGSEERLWTVRTSLERVHPINFLSYIGDPMLIFSTKRKSFFAHTLNSPPSPLEGLSGPSLAQAFLDKAGRKKSSFFVPLIIRSPSNPQTVQYL